MKSLRVIAVLSALLSTSFAALADRDKHEGGHGRHGHGSPTYKQAYWDGHCKVEIKQKHGGYKEERKCKPLHPHAHAHAHAPATVYVVPQPVPGPAYRVVEPSVTIQATIPIR